MREVDACEAKSKLGQLLDWVEAGEDVMITRRGRAMARLTSPDQSFDRERAREAAARIRARRPAEFRTVTRAHVIAWRDELVRRGSGGSTVRYRVSSLASLFEHLCDQNAATRNPVKGVARPKVESSEGRTPALGDHQARALLDAPDADTLKSRRDRAILSTRLNHALRRDELYKLKVRNFRHGWKGVPHLRVSGKGGKTRYLPPHPGPHALMHECLNRPGTAGTIPARCSVPVRNNRTGRLELWPQAGQGSRGRCGPPTLQ